MCIYAIFSYLKGLKPCRIHGVCCNICLQSQCLVKIYINRWSWVKIEPHRSGQIQFFKKVIRINVTKTCTFHHDGLQWSSSVQQTHQNTCQMTNEWGPKTAENIFTLSWWNSVTWQTECVNKFFYCLLVTVVSNYLICKDILLFFTFSNRPHLLLYSLNYQDDHGFLPKKGLTGKRFISSLLSCYHYSVSGSLWILISCWKLTQVMLCVSTLAQPS